MVHNDTATLRAIKLAHTAAWAFFVAAIVAIPLAAWRNHFGWALAAAVIVAVEVAILALNGMKCPLTPIAARYTSDRRDNFDIYLPLWIARYNKEIFGTLYVAGLLFALMRWIASIGHMGHPG
jgi:hypothetical protein